MTLAAATETKTNNPGSPGQETLRPITDTDMSPVLRWRWQLLREHVLGQTPHSAGLPERLVRELGWSRSKVIRALEEYRRFCLLAIEAGGAVSPSPAVDAVWHAHLLYTKDYWDQFCPHVLGMPLHHVPARPGPRDKPDLHAMYRRTLERYQAIFGVAPPPDLWPPPGHPHPKLAYVDRSKYVLVPKLSRKVAVGLAAGAVAVAALLSAGAGPVPSPHTPPTLPLADLGPLDKTGPEFLLFFAIAFAVALAMGLFLRFQVRRPGRVTPGSFTPDAYETAYLSGGDQLAFSAAVASLSARGLIRTDSGTLLADPSARSTDARHPLEQAVLESLRGRPLTARRLQQAVAGDLADLRASLVERGLVPEVAREVSMRTFGLLIALAVPALGLAKIAIGVSRDKPVGFLVAGVILTAIISLAVLARRIKRTTEGDRVLTETRSRLSPGLRAEAIRIAQGYGSPSPDTDAMDPEAVDTAASSRRTRTEPTGLQPALMHARPSLAPSMVGPDPMAFAVAFYGMSILDNTPMAPVRRTVAPTSSDSGSIASSSNSSDSDSSSDSSSSDSGSSDGGGSGCGGCGGGGD